MSATPDPGAAGRPWRRLTRLDLGPTPQLLLIATVTTAVYGRSLARYFVSEDFVILRRLIEEPVWSTVQTELTGPWLGITLVQFFRPLATLMLLAETRVWGTWPPGYLAGHLAVHLLNVTLFYHLVRHLVDERRSLVPATAALLFAVYPLHPNTVVFIASFATLFSATAGLASMLFFVRSRRWAAAICLAVALGCYEASAVLPVLLVGLDLAKRGVPVSWRRLIVRHWPFAGLVTGYLILRHALLGSAIGGYREFRERLGGADLSELIAQAQLNWPRLLCPVYEPAPPAWVGALVALVLVAGTVWGLWRFRNGVLAARLWLLAALWIFVSQVPFGVVDVVPANGRYWYLSSAGLGLLLAAAASAVAPPRRQTLALAVVSTLVGGTYLVLLNAYLGRHLEASALAETVQRELSRTVVAGGGPVFLAGHPDFVYAGKRAPVAQVFHWGLSDALQPPFVDREIKVYPLPRFSAAELLPVTARPDLGTALRWDATSKTLRPIESDALDPPRRIVARESTGGRRIRFEPVAEAERYRLILLARGHPSFAVVRAGPGDDGLLEAPLPTEFLTSMGRLYADDVFWWIEAEDRAGAAIAFSDVRTLCPAATPRAEKAAPDVVLITVDTLRADRLGCYGAATRTPNIDRLAAEGVLFEHAASPVPETRPAHFTMFTSRYPRDHGVLSNATAWNGDAPALPRIYAQAGYASAGFASCALFAGAGAELGFGAFDLPQAYQRSADKVVPRAIEWLRSVAADQPVFLWLHLFDPHMPYQPPPPFNDGPAEMLETWPDFTWPGLLAEARLHDGDLPRPVFERALALYDGEVEYVDHWLGQFFDALRELGRWNGTVIALAADHGECFSKGVFFDHSQCLSDEAIAVPLIVRHPPRVAAGRRVATQVELLDLAPALLRLSDLEVPAEFMGEGLLRRAQGETATYAFFEHPYYSSAEVANRRQVLGRLRSVAGEATRQIFSDRLQVGARSGAWKYLRRGADETLYNVADDPGELTDVSAEEAVRRDRFRLAVRKWMRDHPPRIEPSAEIDPELRKSLEALGYL